MSYTTYAVPISVKGIVFEDNKVWLRKNERDEWELPGGKLDQGEQPPETAVREMEEELGFDVSPISLVQARLYIIETSSDESKGVLVVSYLCEILGRVSDFEWEGEAGTAQFKAFPVGEIGDLTMPNFYKEAIHEGWKLFRGP